MFSLCKNLALGGTSTAWELEVGAGKEKLGPASSDVTSSKLLNESIG